MSAQHTPGPWSADTVGNGLAWDHPSATRTATVSAEGGIVALVPRCANPRRALGNDVPLARDLPDHDECSLAVEIRDANARLIEAAPDLLEALRVAAVSIEDLLGWAQGTHTYCAGCARCEETGNARLALQRALVTIKDATEILP